MIRYEASNWSLIMNEIGTPDTHIITTLYTLIPMYLESFKAGMLTSLVSQAKKHPNICKGHKEKVIKMEGVPYEQIFILQLHKLSRMLDVKRTTVYLCNA